MEDTQNIQNEPDFFEVTDSLVEWRRKQKE